MPSKRKDGLYQVRQSIGRDINNKLIYKSFYGKTIREARAKAQQYITDMEVSEATGENFGGNSTSFEKLARQVLELKKDKVKENTWALSWKNVIERYLIPHFGKADIQKIKKMHIEQYFDMHKNLSRETLKKHLSCFNEIFKTAVDNEYIKSNPLTNFRLEIGKKSAEKRVYSADQVKLVLQYAKEHRFGLDVHLLLKYGLIVSELLGIKTEDVDLQQLLIKIQRGVTRSQTGALLIDDTKNKYRNRTIAISEDTAELIRSHMNNEFLISTATGSVSKPDTWRKRHYAIFMRDMQAHYAEMGIDIPALNPHELRHTRASIWVNEGRNLFAVAEQMGWADLDMLRKRYAHGDIQQLRKELGL